MFDKVKSVSGNCWRCLFKNWTQTLVCRVKVGRLHPVNLDRRLLILTRMASEQAVLHPCLAPKRRSMSFFWMECKGTCFISDKQQFEQVGIS